jgi:hypothetical protein
MIDDIKIAKMIPSRIELTILDAVKVAITGSLPGTEGPTVSTGLPTQPVYQEAKLRKIAKFAGAGPQDPDAQVRAEFRKLARQDGKLIQALQTYQAQIDAMFPGEDVTTLTVQDIAFAEGFVSVGRFDKKPADWSDDDLVVLLKKVVVGGTGPTG